MRRALSILLSIILTVSSISVVFTLEAGAVATNKLPKGDFSDVSDFVKTTNSFTVNGFTGSFNGGAASTVATGTASDLPAGVKSNTNVINYTLDNSTKASNAAMYSNDTYLLKENTYYEASVWVKTSNLYGFKLSVYEPTYTDRLNVTNRTSAGPWEGQNIYSYYYDGGADVAPNTLYRTTRVARTDLTYNYKANGLVTEGSGTANASVFYLRGAGTAAEITNGTAIYATPATPTLTSVYYEPSLKYGTATNGWVKVSMSFKTKSGSWSYPDTETAKGAQNLNYAVPVALGFGTRDQAISATNTTLSVAGFAINEGNYTVNASVDSSYKGGTVSVNNGIAGQTASGIGYVGGGVTATPYLGSEFLGWYNGATLVSTAATYNFDPTADTTLTARFNNYNIFNHQGFEDYAVNTVLANGATTPISIDGWHATVSWGSITAVNSPVYSGSRSARIDHRYNDTAYYEFSVEQNKNYTVNFKWYMAKDTTLGGTVTTATRYLKVTNSAGTRLSATDNAYIKGTGTWQDITITFNSGANTIARLAVVGDTNSTVGTDQLHIDDLYIFKQLNMAATKNNNGGAATVSKTTAIPGDTVTFTAKAYDGNSFDGWYKDGVLYSTSTTLSKQLYADLSLEARFTDRNLVSEQGFEQIATGEFFNNSNPSLNTAWNGSASWANGTVSTAFAASGTKSLQINARHNSTSRTVTGLSKNTNYVFSMYYYITSQFNAGHVFNFAAVTSSTYTYPTNPTGDVGAPDGVNVLGKTAPTTAFGAWTKVSVPFNTGDNTDVKLQFRYASDATSGNQSLLFVDEMSLYRCYKVTTATEGTGGVINTPAALVAPGNTATLTAVPLSTDTFLGWYLGATKVSDTATFTTPAITGDVQYTAKFTSNGIATNGDFESYANNTRLDNYTSPETALPATSWHGDYQWYQNNQRFPSTNYSWVSASVTNTKAHSGTNSLLLAGMFQGYYHEIYGLQANKNYNLSFYYWLPAWDATKDPNLRFASVVPGTSQVDLNGNPYNYPNVSNTADRDYFSTYNSADTANDLWQPAITRIEPGTKGTGSWEQVTLTFNSGNNASIFLALGFNALAGSDVRMYVDDITLAVAAESLSNFDADTNAGKFTKGPNNVTYSEVDTTASDPAILGSKVYGITTGADYQYSYGDTMVLKAGKRYDVSFYFKVADNHTMLTTGTTGLQYVSFFIFNSNLGTTTGIPIQSAFTLTREPVGGEKVTGTSQTGEFMLSKSQVVNASNAPVWQKITASFTPTSDTPGVFAVRPNAAGTVYIDRVKVTCAENEAANVVSDVTAGGTAIRTSGTQALRFKTSINKAKLAQLYAENYEIVEYGSIAIKTAYLQGQELVEGSYTQPDTTVKNTVKGAAYIKGTTNKIFSDDGTNIVFTAALTGISQQNYNTSYSVRAYVVLQRPDGSKFTVYDDTTKSATIYNIANAAYNAPGGNDGYAELPAVRDYLQTNIISKANFTTYPNDGFSY